MANQLPGSLSRPLSTKAFIHLALIAGYIAICLKHYLSIGINF